MRLDALIAIQRLDIYFKTLYMSEKSTRKKELFLCFPTYFSHCMKNIYMSYACF